MAYKVVIDPGHGGYDGGAVYNDRVEKVDNLDLALVVGDILDNYGIDVIYTRTDDVYISPLDRARMANEEDADLFVSIHRNSSPEPNTYSGVQSLVYSDKSFGKVVADHINEELEEVGFQNLGTDERTDLIVLRRTEMPAVLVEVGFLNTDIDNMIFDENFEDIAYGIATGILDALDVDHDLEDVEDIYHVQVGLFRVPSNAETLKENLSMLGYEVAIVPQGDLLAVQVGNFSTLEEALELEEELRLQGYSTLVVRD
ncbi:MAG: N-acetylmuramoyl-L-alanine amidase [Anaerocolumna sp.]